jgi:acetyl-CoA C-acetyltransferase
VSHQPCAIVGIGQTHHKRARRDVSYAGLVREAAQRALDDAQMTWSDIDAVVVGKAPDLFEGVMKPELYLSDALGATGKPMFRVHTAGSVGGTTGIVAAHHVETGRHERVLAVAFEKQSEGNAQFALGSGRGASIGAGGAFAPYMRLYMYRTGAPADIGPMVAVKDRLNACKNEYAHLKLADITIDTVKASPMMWDPVRFLESCPSSDGACAVVFTNREGGEAAARAGRQPAWILGSAVRSEPSSFPGRDPVRPQGAVDCAWDVYGQAGITDPRRQIDCAELYVPFSWYEPMWLEAHDIAEPGEGWKMVERGDTALDGSFPVNMSGGVLSSNPIGASGLLRFSEAALQVRGMAGEHQVDGAKVALAQAYGASAQYFSMWVVSSSLDPFGN